MLIQVIFGNRKSCSRIKQNSELATKLDKLLNKTTCEVHVGGEHPSSAERLDFITTEHTAEHHITPAVSELTTEYNIMPANSELTSNDVLALRLKSCSMKNFAVKLMRELFTKEELENKTLKGTRSAKGGKEGLDKRRLQIIRDYVLQFYPTSLWCRALRFHHQHNTLQNITSHLQLVNSEYDIMNANSGLTSDDVLALKLKNCSMKNFAVKIMKELFTKEELENYMVKGTRSANGGKEGLHKRRLQIISDYVLQFYPKLPEKT